jgi:site-specific DNA-methyltransferase (adenine-specific)
MLYYRNKKERGIMNTKLMFSSASNNWRTPTDTYNDLNKEFNFDFDPCPLRETPLFDGLNIDWGKSNFVNPPYGKELKHWIKKGYEESLKGNKVVMLIASRTDTNYWHEYVMKAKEIRFIKGRLKFGDSKNSAPFPSCIIIF